MRYLKVTLPLAMVVVVAVLLVKAPERLPGGVTLRTRLLGRKTVADRLHQFGPAARARLAPDFARVGVAYPPPRLVLLGLKSEKELQAYAPDGNGRMLYIKSFPILGASGRLGPKLRESDLQVPEGLYRIASLNPNSAFHLALRVDYPNEFDLTQAAHEGRTALGGDIMIHGNTGSAGCLAMGDAAAEDLFVMTGDCGSDNVRVVLSPVDFRRTELPADLKLPVWAPELYAQIKAELKLLPLPANQAAR